MEKLFIPYELSLKLKEMGCDVSTLAYYDDKGIFYPMGTVCSWESINFGQFIPKYQYVEGLSILVSAPLWEQAFKWFREKHYIDSAILPTFSTKYIYRFYEQQSKSKTQIYGEYMGKEYETYEEAREACLLKLIELYKN